MWLGELPVLIMTRRGAERADGVVSARCEDLAVPAGGDLTGGIPSVTLHFENVSIRFHLVLRTEHVSKKMMFSLGMLQLPLSTTGG